MAVLTIACAAPVTPPLLRAPPTAYLLGIDQLISPDFTYDSTPHRLTAVSIAAAGGAADGQLVAAGFAGGAAEDFFRNVPDLAVVNGPVQIGDTVEEFDSANGAASVYGADLGRLDAEPGSTAVSTGTLGDAAHATTRTARTNGTVVLELTVEWRVDNLLDILVVRGRDGGVRPDDALLLAHRQTVIEIGRSASTPSGTASSTPTSR